MRAPCPQTATAGGHLFAVRRSLGDATTAPKLIIFSPPASPWVPESANLRPLARCSAANFSRALQSRATSAQATLLRVVSSPSHLHSRLSLSLAAHLLSVAAKQSARQRLRPAGCQFVATPAKWRKSLRPLLVCSGGPISGAATSCRRRGRPTLLAMGAQFIRAPYRSGRRLHSGSKLGRRLRLALAETRPAGRVNWASAQSVLLRGPVSSCARLVAAAAAAAAAQEETMRRRDGKSESGALLRAAGRRLPVRVKTPERRRRRRACQ